MATEFDPRSEAELPPSAADAESFERVWTAQGGLGDGGWDLPERFELSRDLGDGLAGPVFVVRDIEHGSERRRLEIVSSHHTPDEASKVALEESLRAAGRVESPFVFRCREFGRLGDGRVYALSDFTSGETLAAELKRETSFHADHALEVARQVLRGLEAIHESGLAHGGLSDTTVWLASGVAKTDSDPFGVRASISDLGLARWMAPQGEPSSDLAAVGDLLARMIGATTPTDQKLFDAALAVADGARGRGAARYESASQMRMAIDALLERSRRTESAPTRASTTATAAGRERTVAAGSSWAKPAFAAALLGCGALGWFGWRQRGQVLAAERDASTQRAEIEAARLAAANVLAQAQERAERLQAQADEAAATLAAEREREASDKRRTEQLLLEAQRDLDLAHGKAEELAKSLGDERARAERVEADLRRVSELADASVRAARGFDSTLELIGQGRGEEATRRAALLESEGLFGERTDFTSNLAAASAALARFVSSRDAGEVDVVAVREGAEALERARAQRAEFVAEGAAWLALELLDAPPTSRVARLDGMLAQLGEQLAAATATRDRIHAEEWAAIMAGPGIQDPALAFRHAERFSCSHLDDLVERFARELCAWVLVDGALDVGRLNTFHQLASWAERVERGEVRLPAELANDLQLLAHAQRWYDFDPSNDARMDLSAHAPRTPLRTAKDWKAELYLEWRLSQPDSEYPISRGRTHWYRSVDADGAVEWWRESADAADADAWRVRRALFSADRGQSRGEGVIVVERRAGRVAVAGSNLPLLDLHARGDAVLVGPPPTVEPARAPDALGLDPARVDAFRAATRDEACLIYVQGDVRRWVSPRLGLVREETKTSRGWTSLDLVCIEP